MKRFKANEKYLRTHIFKNYWTFKKAMTGKDQHKSRW